VSPRPAAALRRRAPRVRTRDPEAKRALAVEAARRLFAERGYAATTTADVARHAGVSEGILFHHFGSKEGLLAAVAGEYGRGLAAAMFGAAPLGPSLPSAAEMLRRAFAFVREQGTLARILVLSPDPGSRETARRASRAQIVAALSGAFADWSARGLLRPMDPQIVAELLFALVEAALTQCFVHGDGEREEEYLRETVRCVEGALAPRVPSPAPTEPSTPPEERNRA
jgi:AcrR family transcriptional regulator